MGASSGAIWPEVTKKHPKPRSTSIRVRPCGRGPILVCAPYLVETGTLVWPVSLIVATGQINWSDVQGSLSLCWSKAVRRLVVAFHRMQEQRERFVATGTVKWFNEQKGYGFIQPDSGGKDVFVHISAVERSGLRSLSEGQKISYELETDRRTGKQSAGNLKTA